MNSIEELIIQRENIINNENKILKIKKEMSDLKLNQNVAIYAHSLEAINYGEEIDDNLMIIDTLKDDKEVQEYISLNNELDDLNLQKKMYYIKLQTDFKDDIDQTENPSIYVYYGKDKDDNTITRNMLNDELSDTKNSIITILPSKEIKSKRKIRHFYNKTRFKYLEEIVKANSLLPDERI